jgi:glycosyltransferase involved in cell wall biosynthesis
MIKIAIIVPKGFFTMPERFGGGIVRAYKIYVEQLSKKSFFKIRFYCYNPINKALYLTDILKTFIRINKYNPDIILSPCEVDISILFTLILGVITRKPVVIVFNTIPFTGFVGSGLFLDEKIAFKYSIQSCLGKNDLKNLFLCSTKSVMKFLLVLALMYAARFLKKQIMAIAITSHIGEELQRRKLKVANVYPGNGIDELQIMLSHVKIYDACYIASPVHIEKGLLDVLYIWYSVTKKNPRAKLIIAGRIMKDYQEERLQDYIQKLGLNENVILRVSYEGLSHNEILNLLPLCKVFLYPTRKDVWPLIIGETLSIGLPVITYMLHNIEYAYGWCPAVKLIRVGAVQEVAEEILKLLQDDTQLISTSKTALECAEKMTWKRVALLEAKAILKALKQYYSN